MTKQLNLTVNRQNIQITEQVLDGKRYLVGPIVLAKVGVMNETLMTLEEMTRFLASWGDIAVPLSHPVDDEGNFISAKSPEVLEQSVVGRFLNPFVDANMLKGEVWVDVEKAESLPDGQRVIEALLTNQMIEVSSGFFAEIERANGIHNGEEFSGIWRNIIPDHAAILLDEIGACSCDDGCGFPRVNVQEDKGLMQTLKEKINTFFEELFIEDESLGIQANSDESNGVSGESLEEVIENMKDEIGVVEEVVVETVINNDAEVTALKGRIDELTGQLAGVNGLIENFGGLDELASVITNAKSIQDQAQAAENDERERLTAALSTNGVSLSEEDIAATPVTALRALCRQYQPVNYSGQGQPIATNTEELPAPKAVLLAKKESN